MVSCKLILLLLHQELPYASYQSNPSYLAKYHAPSLLDSAVDSIRACIQSYARKEFDKLWDEYKRVLNPQHYPVDLAHDIWQDKMELIDKMRKEALGEGEEE